MLTVLYSLPLPLLQPPLKNKGLRLERKRGQRPWISWLLNNLSKFDHIPKFLTPKNQIRKLSGISFRARGQFIYICTNHFVTNVWNHNRRKHKRFFSSIFSNKFKAVPGWEQALRKDKLITYRAGHLGFGTFWDDGVCYQLKGIVHNFFSIVQISYFG